MTQADRLLVKDEQGSDLASFSWDDRLFSDLLASANCVNTAQAMDISRSLMEEIRKREIQSITVPLLETIIQDKLKEYGIFKTDPVRLDSSLFVRKGKLVLSANARTVLERRYLRKDLSGKIIETPEEMFRRVAKHIAKAEKAYGDESRVRQMEEVFHAMMTEFKFLPNSPTLMNAGRRLGQLAACFVLPVEDSMEGIFDALKSAALIHKSGGGTGFAFSRLRPKNSKVGTTGGVASGPVSFMKIFNTATEQVKQGGTRRGANMAILRVDHPDIVEFITCKKDNRELNNFNISVGVTDAFMEAVKAGKPYDLIDPREKKKVGELDAPGGLPCAGLSSLGERGSGGDLPGSGQSGQSRPLDWVKSKAPTPAENSLFCPWKPATWAPSTWPSLSPPQKGVPSIDYNGLKELVWNSVRFLDNVIDMSKYPLPEIEKMARGNRKIGLGVMGFADMLFQLGSSLRLGAGPGCGGKSHGLYPEGIQGSLPGPG